MTCYHCEEDYIHGTYDLDCPDCLVALQAENPRWLMSWHGGSSYADPGRTVEPMDSLREAVAVMRSREHGQDPYCPAVEGSSAWMHHGSLVQDWNPVPDDLYPDRVIEQGPRGAFRVIPG